MKTLKNVDKYYNKHKQQAAYLNASQAAAMTDSTQLNYRRFNNVNATPAPNSRENHAVFNATTGSQGD